jgi:hypothetical protein
MAPPDKSRFCNRTQLKHPLTAEYQHYRVSLHDLSVTGAFIKDDLLLPVGQPIPLTIWLNDNESIEVEAIVRRASRGEGHGVEFVGMNHADSLRLRDFLTRTRAPET